MEHFTWRYAAGFELGGSGFRCQSKSGMGHRAWRIVLKSDFARSVIRLWPCALRTMLSALCQQPPSHFHHHPNCLFFWSENGLRRMSGACNRFPDRGILGILHTCKYYTSSRHSWFPCQGDSSIFPNLWLRFFQFLLPKIAKGLR